MEKLVSPFIQAKSVFHQSVLFKYLNPSKNTRFEMETSLHIRALPGNPYYQSASILDTTIHSQLFKFAQTQV